MTPCPYCGDKPCPFCGSKNLAEMAKEKHEEIERLWGVISDTAMEVVKLEVELDKARRSRVTELEEYERAVHEAHNGYQNDGHHEKPASPAVAIHELIEEAEDLANIEKDIRIEQLSARCAAMERGIAVIAEKLMLFERWQDHYKDPLPDACETCKALIDTGLMSVPAPATSGEGET